MQRWVEDIRMYVLAVNGQETIIVPFCFLFLWLEFVYAIPANEQRRSQRVADGEDGKISPCTGGVQSGAVQSAGKYWNQLPSSVDSHAVRTAASLFPDWPALWSDTLTSCDVLENNESIVLAAYDGGELNILGGAGCEMVIVNWGAAL